MSIFLTGINGFSGSHLAKHLLKKEHRLIAMSRRTPIAHATSTNMILLQGDLNTLHTLPHDVDTIIHTAAISPTPSAKVSDFIHDNILATHRLIQLAKTSHVKRFIFFSSLSIYGEIKDAIVNEKTPVLNPDVYGASKLLGELSLQEHSADMPSIALRLPAILGLGASRHWLANTIARAFKGEEIKIFNPTAPFNNAVHIEDLCHLIDTLLTHPCAGFNPLTLGANSSLTIEAIVKKVLLAMGSTSKIIIDTQPQHAFTISSDRAKKDFFYNPRTLENMLELYLTDFLRIAPQIHRHLE